MANEPEIDFKRQMYIPMLNLFVEVTESLNKRIFPPMEYDHLQGFTYKLYVQANTALYLSKGTPVIVEDSLVRLVDRSSMMNLARSALESCAVFYHNFITPEDEDTKNFRLLNSILRGLNTRKNAKPSDSAGKAKLQREKNEMAQLYNQIQATKRYQLLRAKITNPDPILQEKRRKEFDDKVKNGKFDDAHKVDMLRGTGISEKVASILYGMLSDHSHSGYISFLQAISVSNQTPQSEDADDILWHFLMALCLTIKGFAQLFPEVQEVLDSNPYPANQIPIIIEVYNKMFDEEEKPEL